MMPTVLGVPHLTVIDYLLSNDVSGPGTSSSGTTWPSGMIAIPGCSGRSSNWPAYLDAAFDEVWRRYGSFGAFLSVAWTWTA